MRRRQLTPSRKIRLLGAMLSAALIAAGCGSRQASTPDAVLDVEDLTAALERAGVQPSWVEGAAIEGISVPGRALQVAEASLEVFQYESEQDRETDAALFAAEAAIENSARALSGERVNLWVSGRLIVRYRGADGATILLISGLLGDPITSPEVSQDEPYPPAVLAALGGLAENLGAEPAQIEMVRYRAVDWPDACLGIARPGESCSPSITPGWEIDLRFQGVLYRFHSDELGLNLRQR